MNVEEVLNQRKTQHGDYELSAIVKKLLRDVMTNSKNWAFIDPAGEETLLMIAEKLGRILVGNYRNVDHWQDIAGYATLMYNHLIKERKNTNDNSN